MGKVICCSNSKGGVGKSTSNFHIAFKLIELGFSVLVIDQETPASISYMLDPSHPVGKGEILKLFTHSNYSPLIHKTPSGIDMIEVGGNLNEIDYFGGDVLFNFKQNISSLSRTYDYIIIDTPPTLTLRLDCALACADFVFTPLAPEPLVVLGFNDFVLKYSNIRQRFNQGLPSLPYVFFNKVRGKSKKHPELINEFNSFYDSKFNLFSCLFEREMVPDAVDASLPVWLFSNNADVNKEFDFLLTKIISIVVS